MNREEILAKSQKENQYQMDERSKSIETRASSISQGVGMALCILLGAVSHAVTHDMLFMDLALSLYLGMFAAERIACAVMEKSKAQWVLAGVITAGAVAALVVYVLTLFKLI